MIVGHARRALGLAEQARAVDACATSSACVAHRHHGRLCGGCLRLAPRRLIRSLTYRLGGPAARLAECGLLPVQFPGLSQTDDSMAAALDARNDDGAIAALRRAHPSLPLVTFSRRCAAGSSEKRYLFVPAPRRPSGRRSSSGASRAQRTCMCSAAFPRTRLNAASSVPSVSRERRDRLRSCCRLLPGGRARPTAAVPAGLPFRSRRRRSSSARAARSCRATGAAGLRSTT